MKTREIRFGRNLKALREIHDVKQQQLAEELHMSRQTISCGRKEMEERVSMIWILSVAILMCP